MSGAVDLSGLKERADAERSRAAAPPRPPQQPTDRPAAAGSVPSIVEITEATFESEVIARSEQVLVVVDLWATWCGPCKQLSPVLERLADQADGRWILATVDVDANPRIAQAFGVQSIPTVVAIAAGQPVSAFQGVQPEAQISAWIDEILGKVSDRLTGLPAGDDDVPVEEPGDPRMDAAGQLLDDGDFEGALEAYRALAEQDPQNVEAASAARNIEFVVRARAHDPSVVDTTDPTDVDATLAAADVLLLDQQPDAAFDRLIATIRATGGDDRSRVRERLLSLFELFDPAEPFVTAARRKLASALF
ncbi:tetratricopeptide repeat protein [Williamsia sp. SKLECPSW1]